MRNRWGVPLVCAGSWGRARLCKSLMCSSSSVLQAPPHCRSSSRGPAGPRVARALRTGAAAAQAQGPEDWWVQELFYEEEEAFAQAHGGLDEP
jgi:hypothetical protein